MSTSNRLARAVDRARELAQRMESQETISNKSADAFALRELEAVENRSILLLRALRLFYGALSGFASSAFVSLLGSLLVAHAPRVIARTIELSAVVIGFLAVGCLVFGALLLIQETRIAVMILHEQTAQAQRNLRRKSAGRL